MSVENNSGPIEGPKLGPWLPPEISEMERCSIYNIDAQDAHVEWMQLEEKMFALKEYANPSEVPDLFNPLEEQRAAAASEANRTFYAQDF